MAHYTKKLDFILTFKEKNLIYCIFTEIGLKKFNDICSIGLKFNSAYKDKI
jgi:hypothetical protein